MCGAWHIYQHSLIYFTIITDSIFVEIRGAELINLNAKQGQHEGIVYIKGRSGNRGERIKKEQKQNQSGNRFQVRHQRMALLEVERVARSFQLLFFLRRGATGHSGVLHDLLFPPHPLIPSSSKA